VNGLSEEVRGITPAQFELLIDEQGAKIHNFCKMLTKSRADADDLYQDAFLQSYKLLHKIEIHNNPSSFIITVAVRLWKSKQRKTARRMSILQQIEIPEFEIADPAPYLEDLAAKKYACRKFGDKRCL